MYTVNRAKDELGSVAGSKGKKKGTTFTIDCRKPVKDKIMDIASLEKFLQGRIKVGAKAGTVGDSVIVTGDKSKIMVTYESNLLKRYLKYLTKKKKKKKFKETQYLGLASCDCFKQGQKCLRAQVLQHHRERGRGGLSKIWICIIHLYALPITSLLYVCYYWFGSSFVGFLCSLTILFTHLEILN